MIKVVDGGRGPGGHFKLNFEQLDNLQGVEYDER